MASVGPAEASLSASMNSIPLLLERLATPIGVMLLVTDDRGRLRALDWVDHEERMRRLLVLHYGPGGGTLRAGSAPRVRAHPRGAYFAGELGAIDRVPVETGGTPFQREVWAALRRIPAGDTMSYGALAARIERRSAVRAVGRANGANPVGIVVPCTTASSEPTRR